MKIGKKILQVRWGEQSLVALYISVLSGILLTLQYDPEAPYYSVSFIEIIVPFGSFWRALHFYSSQFFFILASLHLLVIMHNCGFFAASNLDIGRQSPAGKHFGTCHSTAMARWLRLIASMPVLLLLLFTGYVLRADSVGESAGVIAENIALSVPIFGDMINQILFSVSSKGVQLVYANHLIGLGILWGYLSWEHLHRFKVGWRKHGELVVLLVLLSFIFPVALEAEKLGVFHRPGPWFFLGLQELLRYIQPVWAGIVFPASAVFAMVLLPLKGLRRWALGYICFCAAGYLILSVIGLLRIW